MPQPPVIAIVGRPNVGKSSLANALVGKRISIVQDMPGVTRDRVSTYLRVDDRYIELVDTGGYGYVDPDALTEHIKHQIELAMAQADLVLFVVDAQEGLTSADEHIASLLRRKGIKTVLIANKADGPRTDPMLGDFARLGLGTPVGVSALNNRNLDQLADAVRRNIDLSEAPTEMPPPQMLTAIVGKRNAGKSTLVNAIAEVFEGHGDRVIVSEVPGTTRDSIDVRFEKDGKALVVIDTAGVRKKRHMVTNDVEFYSFHRAERSIRRADVVMMLIDGMEPISEPDKKLAQYIASQHKPVVLVVNKWDLVLENARQDAEQKKSGFSSDLLMDEFREYLDQELQHVNYAPVAFITAKDKRNVQAVLDQAQHLYKQVNTRVTTHKLNDAVKQILTERRPSTPSGRKARIYYVTQADVAPPTIVLFVNNENYINETYQRFMINRMRELLPYSEVPIKLVVREKERQRGPSPKGQRPVVSLDDAADVKPGRAVQKQLPRAKAKAKARAQPKPMRGRSRGKGSGPSKRR
jgi:GTP-binding protein